MIFYNKDNEIKVAKLPDEERSKTDIYVTESKYFLLM